MNKLSITATMTIAALTACSPQQAQDPYAAYAASDDTTAETGISVWHVQHEMSGGGSAVWQVSGVDDRGDELTSMTFLDHTLVAMDGSSLALQDTTLEQLPFVTAWWRDHADLHHTPDDGASEPARDERAYSICYENCETNYDLCEGAKHSWCLGQEVRCTLHGILIKGFLCPSFLGQTRACQEWVEGVDECWEEKYEACLTDWVRGCQMANRSCTMTCAFGGCSGPGGPI